MQPQDYAYLYELEENFWWFIGMREITRTLLDPILPAATNRRVLDAGCGTGSMMSWLARYVDSSPVTGIDLSPIALGFSRQRGHTRLARASITEIPFADSTFDLVTSFDVIQHVPVEQFGQAFSEIHRVLRPGGLAFVRVSAYEWLRSGHDDALNVQRRYRRSELSAEMRRAGFTIRRATYANSLLFPVAILKRLVFFSGAGSDVKPWRSGFEWMNGLLTLPLLIEARALNTIVLPVGLSAIVVGEKPASQSFASKVLEEREDSGLPLSSAERLAFPASLKQLSRLCLRTAEAEPPQLVRSGDGKASLTALGCGKPPAPLPAIGLDPGSGTFEAKPASQS